MSNLIPPRRPGSTNWQYWIAGILPIMCVTTLTIALPGLIQPTVVADLGAIQEHKIQQQIRSISIKVLARGTTIGSGVLLDRHDRFYTVITNAHVIQSSSAPFQIQTPDGLIYGAALIDLPTRKKRDLSMLRFQSLDRIYNTAKLAGASPRIGDRVWSSGYPLTDVAPLSENLQHTDSQAAVKLSIADGRVTHILPTALTGGYNIGSDNAVRKGMSGGPLIDRQGNLVGINGVHADPLWEIAETLENGATVNGEIQEQIDNFSWAIPIEFVKEYISSQKAAGKFKFGR
jgi:S1-C subfamily serine protease